MSMNIGRLGLASLLAQALLGSSGSFEPSRPRSYQSQKPMIKPIPQRSGNKLAKRLARGKKLFRA